MNQSHSNSPTIVLALDTSSAASSLAVARENQVVASRVLYHDDRRSEELWADLETLLCEADISFSEIGAFAVCTGPGAFTGLRVGIAAVKGLAFAAERPAVGITSLEAAAFGARTGSRVCAMVNAYKGEVYSQTFRFDESGAPVAVDQPSVSTSAETIQRLGSATGLVFTGDGVSTCEALILGAGKNRDWSIKKGAGTAAESIALLALLKKESWGEPFGACYVRPADAQIKLAQGLLGSKIRRTISGKA